jgi:hypothetical protein
VKTLTRCPDCNAGVLSLHDEEGRAVLLLDLDTNVYVLESYNTTTGQGSIARSRAHYPEHKCRCCRIVRGPA